MSTVNRTAQELLVDYAGALRDGSVPTFLKSLGHDEVRSTRRSLAFWEAAEVVRLLNELVFSDRATIPDAGLFASRVNSGILRRIKKAKAPLRPEALAKGFRSVKKIAQS
jgi:hypothetical protein